MTDLKSKFTGPIAWMAKNSVAANLLMIVFIVGGLLVASRIKQEVFPEFTLDFVQVQVPYPGASPEEVEQGILLVIEDEVRGIDNVKTVDSQALEGMGQVTIELLRGANTAKALQDVKNAVDRIQSFPEESEKPIVSLVEARRQVISLVIYGDVPVRFLRSLAENARDTLLQNQEITLVELAAAPNPEISVEIPQRNLREYNLTLGNVAQTVRRSALELPGGGIKTTSGEVLLRTQERRDYASQFSDIPILINQDGSRLLLSDIAQISEDYEDIDLETFFNGKPAMRVNIFRVGDQTPIGIAEIVHDYVQTLEKELPPNISVSTWDDSTEIYRDRIGLLLKNAALGLFLVLLVLGIFLDPRLAFWVAMGIPISIIGSFLFIPFTGASINMISLFAFIVTLGIIVDDAVVVGENVYQKREKGVPFLQAAIEGTRQISVPVTFAVLTNIAAFAPLLFVPGVMGKLFLQIPAITITVFIVSLVECLYILPSHLAHAHGKSKFWDTLAKPSIRFEKWLKVFIHNRYIPAMKTAISHRILTLLIAIAMLIVSLGFVVGGRIQFSFVPKVDSDLVTVQAVLPFGIPIERSREVQAKIIEAAFQTLEDNGGENISRGIYTQIGKTFAEGGPATGGASLTTGSHLIGVQIFLVPSEERAVSGAEFANQWRSNVGEITGIQNISFTGTIGSGAGAPIDIKLSHKNKEILEEAAIELGDAYKNYAGVTDINDGVALGKPQYNFKITPEARSLGITAEDLAQQVRWAFYGAESLRQQRGRDEVKVMVRLPEEERRRLNTIEELILRSPTGGEIPLSEAAEISEDRAYTDIQRSKGRRVLSVTADVDENITNANVVVSEIEKEVLPELIEKYPSLTYSFSGEQQEQSESMEALGFGFIFCMIGIYSLLAVPFKSYIQPIIVMSSIPFGIIGAIIGHLLLGYELSIISMFGIIALSGVVVNDSLVLVVTANEIKEEENLTSEEAMQKAAPIRFRPILLTSLTTFFGLAPMIFETSMQARFLIPMAVSLGFGILFSTFIILFLTPALYLLVNDIRKIPQK